MKRIVHLNGFKPFICCAFAQFGFLRKIKNLSHLTNFTNFTNTFFKHPPLLNSLPDKRLRKHSAFSLVEMLTALLVASLLLAALAPVITRRMGENINVTGNMSPAGTIRKTAEIEFGSVDCSEIKTAEDGSQYCEGEFEVPGGYNGMMRVTVIGAGGGGAAALTAGYSEYTVVGETNTFTVPYGVTEVEATLVSGGAGGGAGGVKVENSDYSDKDGKFSWTPEDITVGKYVSVTGCGGGGGGAGQRGRSIYGYGGGGGSGAYGTTGIYISNKNPWEIHIGGGGGGGSLFGCTDGNKGGYYAGGGGGGGNNGVNVAFGFGGGAGAETGGIGGASCKTSDNAHASRNGGSASPAGGGAGGLGTTATGGGRTNTAAAGGSGGSIAGGGGGGGVRGQAGGGGGGAPTRIIIDNVLAAIWPGGGGGSSASGCNSSDGTPSECYLGGAGGGGGGSGGGKGGNGVDVWYGNVPLPPHRGGNVGLGGYTDIFKTKADGNGPYGGVINIDGYKFGDDNCHGGDSYYAAADVAVGKNGKRGALKITYFDFGVSGGGGGGAAIVPLRKLAVNPYDVLKIKVGRGGKGGIAGSIKDDGTVQTPTIGEDSSWNTTEPNCNVTRISKNSTGEVLLTTSYSTNYAGPTSGSNGAEDKNYNMGGAINDGKPAIPNANAPTAVEGFSNTSGNKGGLKTAGGRGGSATTPFTGTCEPGKGGTETSPDGTNATGYGCGGGGGYSYYGSGGAGSNGYARISWNKYFDVAQKAYKLADKGAGGGGASGNRFTYSISVQSNEMLKFRIGKGGTGGNGSFASSSNNDDLKKLNGAKGGDTVFALDTNKQLLAGGGGGGTYPAIKNNMFANGVGGSVSNLCTYNNKSYLNNERYCIKGASGHSAEGGAGGAGADFKSFTVKVIDSSGQEVEKLIAGAGGIGGIAGATSHGGSSENSYGAGGGGAGLWDLGEVNNSSASNPSRGGNGANGKIIIEWWE